MIHLLKICVLCGILFVAGCGLSGSQAPVEHFYRLPVPQLNPSDQSTPLAHVLLKPVQVTGLYHERALLYVASDRPLELGRYHYHFWNEPPGPLIQRYIRQALLQGKVASRISTISSVDSADRDVGIEVTAFERVETAQGYAARVALDVSMQGRSGLSRQYSYQQQVVVASRDMHDTVIAFGEAMRIIVEQLSIDLRQK